VSSQEETAASPKAAVLENELHQEVDEEEEEIFLLRERIPAGTI
jgi:hypothetical protein